MIDDSRISQVIEDRLNQKPKSFFDVVPIVMGLMSITIIIITICLALSPSPSVETKDFEETKAIKKMHDDHIVEVEKIKKEFEKKEKVEEKIEVKNKIQSEFEEQLDLAKDYGLINISSGLVGFSDTFGLDPIKKIIIHEQPKSRGKFIGIWVQLIYKDHMQNYVVYYSEKDNKSNKEDLRKVCETKALKYKNERMRG